MPGLHSKYSFSGAGRWLYCPYSAELSDRLEKEMDNEDSSEGTRVHAVIEECFENGVKSTDLDPNLPEYPTVFYTLAYAEKLGPGDLAYETKVKIPDLPEASGTFDTRHIGSRILTILDAKNGVLDVQAVENEQLMSYGGAFIVSNPEVLKDIDWVRFAIAQPNSVTNGYQPPIKQWITTPERVLRHVDAIREAVARGANGEGPQPGEHCRYCKAFGACEATQEFLPFLATAIQMPAYRVPAESAKRLLQVLQGLEDFQKGLKAEMITRMTAGREIPGVQLGTTNTHRAWADEVIVANRLVSAYGALAVKPISPAQAEKLGPEGQKIVAELAIKPPGSPKVIF
jgi:hypothetical protein